MKLYFTIFFVLIFQALCFAQETTGTLQGFVTDKSKEAIPFAYIELTETTTNYKYSITSQDNGFFSIPNLSPSSQYKLVISSLGYQKIRVENLAISLGEIASKNFVMDEVTETLQEVVISANGQTQKSGNETLLGKEKIRVTPTISRSIQDITKNLPENNLNSFGGASNRFNNLSIDGIANNDVIGFQEPASGASGSLANGTPGSLSRTQPIGLGAVKQVSVKLSPFDVSIGNFSGASINLVTKNGTNHTHGEIYGYGNNQTLIGRFADGVKQNVSNFHDVQFGAGVGGAIVKDKLFYFVNIEQALSQTPVLNAPGSEASNISLADVEAVSNHLINEYNYNPGTFTNASIRTSSTKLFARLDFNISNKHKLTIRNNYVNSFAENLEWNASIFNFGNQGYKHNSVANSLALELKSNFNSSFSNKLTLGYNTVKEGRDFDGRVFPHIQIATNSSGRIFAGSYREASVYNTDFSTFQFADKLTYTYKKHTFSAGGLFQFNAIEYGFLSAWNGRWEYNSVNDFLNDQPKRIRGVYNINNNEYDFVSNRPSATISVIEAGFYAQDRFQVNNQFTILAGIRLDALFLPSDLPVSDEVKNTPEFSQYDNKIPNKPQINPRLGINYKIDEEGKFSLRAGSGFFTGRIPYLWFAYTEYISGTEHFNIDLRPSNPVMLTENLSDLTSQQPNLAEINLIDTDFRLPQEWKTNIAFQAKLKGNWKLDLEFTYTEVLNGIFFQSINRKEELGSFSGADNRPYFLETGETIKINPNFTNVFLLTNTDGGFRYNATFGLSKRIKGYRGYVGYTYGVSKDISSTVRSSPAANFEWNQAITANNPSLSFSNFDLRHKFVSSHTYDFSIGEKNTGLVSLLYSGRSGSPYSIVYQGDPNRDGSSRNDLVYVPRNASEINLVDIDKNGTTITAAQQWENLNNYIEGNEYLKSRRGKYAERNGAKTPWNHELDMHTEFTHAFKNGKSLTLSLDILNVFNLLNNDWGRLVFVPNVVNSSYSLLNFVKIENGEPHYQFDIDADEKPYVIDTQASRWRGQLGLRYSF
jgi:hypothetical protein